MGKIIILQDKDIFMVWRTKVGRPIPIFGKGESHFSPAQIKDFKKKKTAELCKQIDAGFMSENKATEWGNNKYNDWAESLTKKEKTACVFYTDQGKLLNQELRDKEFVSLSKKSQTRIASLDSAFKKSVVPETISVSRGVSSDVDLLTFYRKAIGTTIEHKGYTSTSLNTEITKSPYFGSGQLTMKIRVSKGSKGIFIEHDNVAPFKSIQLEQAGLGCRLHEIVLPRNSKFNILDVKSTQRGHEVYAELVKK